MGVKLKFSLFIVVLFIVGCKKGHSCERYVRLNIKKGAGMNKIFIPANKPEDWKSLLAEPDKHWKTGYSAKTLAYSWQEANGFPECVKNVFKNSGIELFQNIELLLAFPEYKVFLPGGSRPSQNDIFILAKGNNQLVSMMAEGKVSEPFGKTIAEWIKDNSEGKHIRLRFLLKELGLEENE